MAKTIIEELVVELGLDDTKLVDQAQQADRRLTDSKERIRKGGNEIESGVKRQRSAFAGLQRELVGILALFTAGAGIKQFIASTVQSDSAVGRLSKQVGVSTEELSAWQGVLRRNGGTAEGATSALSTLTNAYQQFIATGNAGLPYLQQLGSLGFRMEDLKTPTEGLLKIADIFSKLDPRRAAFLGRQLGFDEATIALLSKGRAAVQAQLVEQQKIGVVTDANAAAAQRLQDRLSTLNQRWTTLGRTLLTTLAPVIEKVSTWLDRLSDWASRNQGVIEGAFLAVAAGITAIGIALAAANWPLVALVGGITLLGAGFGKVIQESPELQAAMQEIGQSFGDLGSALSDLWTSFTNTAFAKWFTEQLQPGGIVVKGLTALINGLATAISALAAVMRGDWVSGLQMVAAVMRGDFVGAFAVAKQAAEEERKRRPARQEARSQAQARSQARQAADRSQVSTPVAANNNTPPASNPRAVQHAEEYLVKKGLTPEQARGSVAGAVAESRLNPGAVNPTSGAMGIGQWLGSRKKELIRRYGQNPTFDQQLEFLAYELKGGDHGGAHVLKAQTSDEALHAYITKFMRPAPGAETEGDLQRGRAHLASRSSANQNSQVASRSSANQNSQVASLATSRAPSSLSAPAMPAGVRGLSTAPSRVVNNYNRTQYKIDKIEVVTQATDADKIARAIGPAINRRLYVTQANRGLA